MLPCESTIAIDPPEEVRDLEEPALELHLIGHHRQAALPTVAPIGSSAAEPRMRCGVHGRRRRFACAAERDRAEIDVGADRERLELGEQARCVGVDRNRLAERDHLRGSWTGSPSSPPRRCSRPARPPSPASAGRRRRPRGRRPAGAWGRGPRTRTPRPGRASRPRARSCGRCSSFGAHPHGLGSTLGLGDLLVGGVGSRPAVRRSFRRSPARRWSSSRWPAGRPRAPAAAGTGTGTASKATVTWNRATWGLVWQSVLSAPTPAAESPVAALARPLRPAAASPSAELCMPTRVTPSMSRSAARNRAVPSWPFAQPLICSEGPGERAARSPRRGPRRHGNSRPGRRR